MPEIDQLVIAGLHRDNEPSLQPPNTYRDCLNMRLVSEGNDTFSLVSTKGNSVDFNLSEFTDEASGDTIKMSPIGWTTYVDSDTNESVAVIFSTATSGEPGGAGEIGLLTVTDNANGLYTPIYHHDGLNFTKTHPIINETIALRENAGIIRAYWTDNFNSPRAINTAKLTRVAPVDIDTSGNTTYMCVLGEITSGGTDYGPGRTAGQVFTPTAPITGYTAADSVVEYIPLETLDFTPQRIAGDSKFVFKISGQLNPATYNYAYRLKAENGVVSSWSPLCRPIPVPANSVSGGISGYQQLIGGEITETSTNGNEIQISDIDTNFDEIEVVAVRATDKNVTGNGTLIFSGPITASAMNFTHIGNESLGTVTQDELTEILETIEKANTMASTFNRLFLANTESRAELGNFDPSGATITPFIYKIPSDVTSDPQFGSPVGGQFNPLYGHDFQPNAGVSSGNLLPEGGYKVSGGVVNYNGTDYGPGEPDDFFFVPAGGPYTYSVTSGSPVVNGAFRIKKYDIFGGGEVNKDIEVLEDHFDYKGSAACKHMKGYMRGETYRVGFLPFDKQGNPMFVRWIGDVVINTQSTSGWHVLENDTSNDSYNIRVVGLEIDNLDITDIIDDIGAYAIVRAPRDKVAIAQGILYPTVFDGTDVYPVSTNLISQDYYYNQGGGNQRKQNTYAIHSPEHLMSSGFSIVNDTDKLRLIQYYDDSQGRTTMGVNETINFHYFQKKYDNVAAPGSSTAKDTLSGAISDNVTIDFGDTVASYFPSTTDTFINESRTNVGVLDDGATNFGDRDGRGMKTLIVGIPGSETATSGFGAYNVIDTAKPVVNIERPKTNLYGGQGESALANTIYMFAGHIQKVDSTFKSNIVDGSGNYIVNGIQVFGGDTFICITDFARIVKDNQDEDVGGDQQYSHGVIWPYEGEVNTLLRGNASSSRHLAKDGSYENNGGPIFNTNGVSFDGPSQAESFNYNDSYSHDESTVFYPALPVNFIDNNENENRVRYSDLKTNGESIDNWRVFRVNNFRDLETQNGGITNVRLKNGRLFYWQYRGVGFLPVNERALVANTLGQNVQLGVGGVLDRFDERTRFYGNQNKHGMIDLPEGFAWFDFNNREVLTMNTGMQIAKISTIKGIKRFFDTFFVGDALKNDNPILRQGVTGVYDPKFNEILMVFKAQADPVPESQGIFKGQAAGYGGLNYIAKNTFLSPPGADPDPATDPNNWQLVGPSEFTIGFLENMDSFSSFYSFSPTILLRMEERVLMGTEGNKDTITDNKSYSAGDQVTEGFDNYVAINDFTSGSPATQPSSDPTNWTKVSEMQEVFQHNEGDIANFFGIVYDTRIQMVTNPERKRFKVFDTFELIGNGIMFTDAFYSNTYQNAQDLNANIKYHLQNRSIKYSLPLDNYSRLRDRYLITDLVNNNKNGGTDITSSANTEIKIVSLNIGFRFSK